jgi:hypothetical protein
MCVFEETCACPAGYEGKQCQSPGRILSYLDNKYCRGDKCFKKNLTFKNETITKMYFKSNLP